MAWCLIGKLANEFLKRLKSGEITPEKLNNMTSAERRSYFSEFMGEQNATKTNAWFESKLLLKDQQAGMINWAKRISGIKPETQRDMLAKVNRITEVLQPKEEAAFLNDLVNQRLGMSVTMKEANKIADLAKVTADKKTLMRDDFTFPSKSESMDYGLAAIDFRDYVADLKATAGKLTLKEYARRPVQAISDFAGMAKAAKASMDDSGIFRQGWKLIFNHPATWAKNSLKTFSDIKQTLGGKNVMKIVDADIVSRPNSLNGRYKKGGVFLNVLEEEFPPTPFEKIPVIGRLYSASEVAFSAFARRNRADIADLYFRIAENSGIDMADKTQLRGIGTLVNSLTSRARLGRAEPVADVVNNVFFSPRNFKATYDVLTGHTFGLSKEMTPFARKRAALNAIRMISGSAAILTIANAVRPGSVDWDPRSADFGKVRVGSMKFDVSGGSASIATLASRLATNSFKSSTTGKIKSLGPEEYNALTRRDMVYSFFENKLSPAASVFKDIAKGETFEGEKPTIGREAINLFEPMISGTGREAAAQGRSAKEKAANALVAVIADGLGVSVNVYETLPSEVREFFTFQSGIEQVAKEFKRIPEEEQEAKAKFYEKNTVSLEKAAALRPIVNQISAIRKQMRKIEESTIDDKVKYGRLDLLEREMQILAIEGLRLKE